jgi:ubiquinone/menaquinone biosynthesis C-methylase UbiE
LDHKEVGELWERNAATWTELSRMGFDVYRDHLNAPAFLEMLPDVSGLRGLDIGCGEGYNTRLVARRGAKLTAIDISETFIRNAQAMEDEEPLGIDYKAASALELPFSDQAFDFVMATMSLMDMPDHERVINEAVRVIKPGGFLQFSIVHPCFSTPHFRSVRDEAGKRIAYECGDYFRLRNGDIEEWIFSAAPPELRERFEKFKVPRFTRTLSGWLNLLIEKGFVIERLLEPYADDEAVKRCPHIADTRIIAYFLHIRCRKP